MGTLTLKSNTTYNARDSREYFLFHAMAKSQTGGEFLKKVEQYDIEHPEGRILNDEVDKKNMHKSYHEFKKAVEKGFRGVENVDFDNPQVLSRLKNILQQQLPKETYKTKGDFLSIPLTQADIGYTLACHAEGIKRLGSKYLAQQRQAEEQVVHEPVIVGKSGVVKHGGYGEKQVFSHKSTYKTEKEILVERMLEENRKKR